MTEHLLTAVREGVATLTLNRPEVQNAMSLGMHTASVETMVRIDGDQAVRGVVIRGAGEHFHVGGGVKRFHAALEDDDETRYQTLPRRHPGHLPRHRLAAADGEAGGGQRARRGGGPTGPHLGGRAGRPTGPQAAPARPESGSN